MDDATVNVAQRCRRGCKQPHASTWATRTVLEVRELKSAQTCKAEVALPIGEGIATVRADCWTRVATISRLDANLDGGWENRILCARLFTRTARERKGLTLFLLTRRAGIGDYKDFLIIEDVGLVWDRLLLTVHDCRHLKGDGLGERRLKRTNISRILTLGNKASLLVLWEER